ncbi:MAG: hypothetical protein JOZ05_15780 [Acetobacteraceae bacterium]|nr:hypothetical protein [Acetobacteraceae bacterium]
MSETSPGEDESGTGAGQAGLAARRHSRRLEDKLLVAFHHACDVNDLDVAGQVLRILEKMLTRRPVQLDTSRRRNMENLVAAHERLWQIRHREN